MLKKESCTPEELAMSLLPYYLSKLPLEVATQRAYEAAKYILIERSRSNPERELEADISYLIDGE